LSVLYLYAIVQQASEAPGLGIREAPTRVISEGDLAAIVSEHDDPPHDLDQDELWAHETVVEELMRSAAVLPMRAGSTLADAAAVQALLREQHERFTRSLERVNGAVELGVRAAARTSAPKVPAGVQDEELPGTAYLRARLETQTRSDRVASSLLSALQVLAREHAPLSKSLGGGDVRSAYLVDRDRVDAFVARVEELGHELDDVSIVCTGPWPPYSFVGGSG
jgi:gas vesicle protein GvpL/GvpF